MKDASCEAVQEDGKVWLNGVGRTAYYKKRQNMSETIYEFPTIFLSDGTREYIDGGENTDAYFRRLIRDRLGDDAVVVYDALKDYWLDYYGYREEDNAEAESWRNWAIDVWHELQELVYAKRLDRKKLIALAERMENEL